MAVLLLLGMYGSNSCPGVVAEDAGAGICSYHGEPTSCACFVNSAYTLAMLSTRVRWQQVRLTRLVPCSATFILQVPRTIMINR